MIPENKKNSQLRLFKILSDNPELAKAYLSKGLDIEKVWGKVWPVLFDILKLNKPMTSLLVSRELGNNGRENQINLAAEFLWNSCNCLSANQKDYQVLCEIVEEHHNKALAIDKAKQVTQGIQELKEIQGLSHSMNKQLPTFINEATNQVEIIKSELVTHFDCSTLATPLDIQDFYDNSPEDIKTLTVLLASRDRITNPTLHFFNAISFCGALISKQIMIKNCGQQYYPNLWSVGLASSGSNKSSILILRDSLEKVKAKYLNSLFKMNVLVIESKFTMAGLFLSMGKRCNLKEWAKNNEMEKEQWKMEQEMDSKTHRGRIIVSDEFGFMFSTILNGGKEGKNADVGDILKLADGCSAIESTTGKDGYRAIFDSCLSITSMTQDTTWNDLMKDKNDSFMESGLVGRFFIVNEKAYKPLEITRINDNEPEISSQIETVIESIMAKARLSDKRKMVCEFGYEGGKDWLGDIYRETVSQTESMNQAFESGILRESLFKGKILTQAIKICSIFAFLKAKPEQISKALSDCPDNLIPFELKNREYIQGLIRICFHNFLWFNFHSNANQYKTAMDKMILLLKKYNRKMTQRQIQQNGNIKINGRDIDSRQINEIVEMLEGNGTVITKEEGKSRIVILK